MAKHLVKRLTIRRTLPAPTMPWGSNPAGTAAGIVVDGAAYPLEGEPPPAVSKGWGDLGFLYAHRL